MTTNYWSWLMQYRAAHYSLAMAVKNLSASVAGTGESDDVIDGALEVADKSLADLHALWIARVPRPVQPVPGSPYPLEEDTLPYEPLNEDAEDDEEE